MDGLITLIPAKEWVLIGDGPFDHTGDLYRLRVPAQGWLVVLGQQYTSKLEGMVFIPDPDGLWLHGKT